MWNAHAVARREEPEDVAGAFPAAATSSVERALKTVRSHLGMDVAFVSEFVGDRRFFRHVDSKARSPISAGDSISLEDGYCKKVVDGRLPQLIPDTASVPAAMAMPETHATPIGAHLSVPLRLGDGRVYGTFCCFSFKPDVSLNERDLQMMRAFAEIVAYQIDNDLERGRDHAEKKERIEGALRSTEPSIVYQPWFRLDDGAIVGAESLSRFKIEPLRTPDVWFAEAGEVALKTELELAAIRKALAGYGPAWERAPLLLGLNSSPQTIVGGGLLEALEAYPMDRVIIEITEHEHVEDYRELLRALTPLRERNVKIAIDDAGSGYASMRHILNIAPDFIKLDISLTRDIDTDRTRRALASALIEFGAQTDCKIVAEGVETAAELATLRELGAHKAQGYHLCRPQAVDAFVRLLG